MLQNAEAGMRDKFERGELGMLSLEADNGHLFLRSINEVTYLLVLTGTEVSLGMIRYGLQQAGQALKEQL